MMNRLTSLAVVMNWVIGCLCALFAAQNLLWLAIPDMCRMWNIRDCLIAISAVYMTAWLFYSTYALDFDRRHLRNWLPFWVMGGILLSSFIHFSPVTDPCEGQPWDRHGNPKTGISWSLRASA